MLGIGPGRHGRRAKASGAHMNRAVAETELHRFVRFNWKRSGWSRDANRAAEWRYRSVKLTVTVSSSPSNGIGE